MYEDIEVSKKSIIERLFHLNFNYFYVGGKDVGHQSYPRKDTNYFERIYWRLRSK